MNNLLILLIFLFILCLLFNYDKFDKFDNLEKKNIELVISRYNEDLEWLNTEPFNKYSNIIYNKGVNNKFITNNKTTTIKLKNVGRESESYLNHIIRNYNNLADITIFLPGSLDIEYKNIKATKLINEIEIHQDTVFIGKKHDNVKNELYDFKLDEYLSTGQNNKNINPEFKLELSKIRPFGRWYEHHFKHDIQYVSYLGIIGISKQDILNHPKSYYEKLIKQLQNSSNPEVGHYFERSWEAIFYKLNNPKYIDHYI